MPAQPLGAATCNEPLLSNHRAPVDKPEQAWPPAAKAANLDAFLGNLVATTAVDDQPTLSEVNRVKLSPRPLMVFLNKVHASAYGKLLHAHTEPPVVGGAMVFGDTTTPSADESTTANSIATLEFQADAAKKAVLAFAIATPSHTFSIDSVGIIANPAAMKIDGTHASADIDVALKTVENAATLLVEDDVAHKDAIELALVVQSIKARPVVGAVPSASHAPAPTITTVVQSTQARDQAPSNPSVS
ncbi:hypothetical protein L7F22_018888 [Adiantum nelumboides]|nr:hypothetical protein [Adiantum nelumboides]